MYLPTTTSLNLIIVWPSKERALCALQNVFQWVISILFFVSIRPFQITIIFLQLTNVVHEPSGTLFWDLNPRSLGTIWVSSHNNCVVALSY